VSHFLVRVNVDELWDGALQVVNQARPGPSLASRKRTHEAAAGAAAGPGDAEAAFAAAVAMDAAEETAAQSSTYAQRSNAGALSFTFNEHIAAKKGHAMDATPRCRLEVRNARWIFFLDRSLTLQDSAVCQFGIGN
jgi:hypothetical protein